MRSRATGILTVVLIGLLWTLPARALIIDFQGASGFAGNSGDFFDVSGFRFTNQDIVSGGFLVVTPQNDIVESGTTKLFSANHADVVMTQVGGGIFDLDSFDIGGSFIANPSRWATQVVVTGNLSGGGTVSETINIPNGPAVYQSITLSGAWDALTSATFHATLSATGNPNDFEFTLDNLAVNTAAVPEPGSLILLGIALAGLGFARRRKLH